ncbi:MAG: RidA family protein [Aquificaceae bacterium]
MIPLFTQEAPKPIGPYSQGVKVGNFLFLSGQIGIDPPTGKLKESFEQQVKQVFQNIEAVLKSAGAGKGNIVRVVVYLKDLSLFGDFNRLYEEYLKEVKVKPARTTVEVSNLPLGALIELEITAYIEDKV